MPRLSVKLLPDLQDEKERKKLRLLGKYCDNGAYFLKVKLTHWKGF